MSLSHMLQHSIPVGIQVQMQWIFILRIYHHLFGCLGLQFHVSCILVILMVQPCSGGGGNALWLDLN